jgi:hypothetical protein
VVGFPRGSVTTVVLRALLLMGLVAVALAVIGV